MAEAGVKLLALYTAAIGSVGLLQILAVCITNLANSTKG
jgi:hypothetical protein